MIKDVAVIDKSSGAVVSVVASDDIFDAGEGLVTVDATGKDAYAGCLWSKKNGFTPPLKAPLTAQEISDRRAQTRQAALEMINRITRPVTGQYPEAEVASWPTRDREAQIIIAGGTPDQAPLLAAYAQATQQSLMNVANAVAVKANRYRQLLAAVCVLRDQLEISLGSAQSGDAFQVCLDTLKATIIHQGLA